MSAQSLLHYALISYRKIDRIETRLENIETLLRNSPHRPNPVPESSTIQYRPAFSSTVDTGTTSTPDFGTPDAGSVFGSNSVITQQTSFANELIEDVMQRNSLRDIDPRMSEALANLRQIMEVQRQSPITYGPRFPLQRSLPPGGLRQLEMPPIDVVVALLRGMKSSTPGLFTFICYFFAVKDFSNFCSQVYFPTEDYSDAVFIIVNIGLYYLILECLPDGHDSYLHTTRVNLETALANINLFMPTTVENIQALLLGSFYATDVCRPSVAWQLNTAAALMCQMGGFHRRNCLVKYDSEDADTRAILFWHTYMGDKAMSIRLGRASVIQDLEIDIPRSFNFHGTLSVESRALTATWLRLASFQSRVYEQLLCPAALALPTTQIAERARLLAHECHQMEIEAKESRELAIATLEKIKTSPLVDIYVKGDQVQLLSTLTLIYQAIPAPEGSRSRICDECIETARRATYAHLECIGPLQNDAFARTSYIHRRSNLVLTPFAPFFILFSYIIETLSTEDLELLQEFTTSIQGSDNASEVTAKLAKLCRVISDVATLYVEAKSHQQEDAMEDIGGEFDAYLSQLGFLPVADQSADANVGAENMPLLAEDPQVSQMTDWMSGSRNWFGLLDHDVSQIGE
ncbi:hypothetical protein FIE12Z_12121 [Fusarium flagelliforme]|uniref:Xylanolytic transcriptional activator regulatory domain-containing protein n=1 Tax=Fusarium flagelliforme TaxID=2675880 RepID=A0A395M706_9HYPO|nr:hypothetical protein FIE12Z_12121 [Fusarium flagelliforme]